MTYITKWMLQHQKSILQRTRRRRQQNESTIMEPEFAGGWSRIGHENGLLQGLPQSSCFDPSSHRACETLGAVPAGPGKPDTNKHAPRKKEGYKQKEPHLEVMTKSKEEHIQSCQKNHDGASGALEKEYAAESWKSFYQHLMYANIHIK